MGLDSFVNRLSEKSDDWSDYLLPSAINEAKQMVNSNSFRAIFLFGVIAFLFMALFLYNMPTNEEIGQVYFLLFSSIMDVGLVLFIPILIYQNMSFERSNGSFELMAITSITPLKIVFGKWQSGMLQGIIFGSIVTPGLIFSYFFNGVAISMIFLSLLITLISAQISILSAIFLCSLGVLKSTRLFLQVVSLIANILILIFTISSKSAMIMQDRVVAKLFTMDFFIGFLIFLLILVTVELFMVAISAAQLSAYSANKSTLPRLLLSALVIEVGSIFLFTTKFNEGYFIMIICLFIHAFISFFFMVEKDQLSKKLYMQLQKKENLFKQIWKKLFYPGHSSAYMLYIAQISFLGFSCYFYFQNISNPYRSWNEFNLLGVISCLVFYYSCIYLTVGILHALFPNIKPMAKALTCIFVILIIFIFPFILYLNFDREEELLLMNIFYHLTERYEGDKFNYANLVITSFAFVPALLLALFSDNRKVEEIRDFVAGERGST